MFYDELAPDDKCPAPNDKCPTPGTLGAPVLEEKEGGGTYNLKDLLDRKGQKKEASSLGSWECVVV